jgi:hypothetical protein
VQSPGAARPQATKASIRKLEAYVKGVVGAFANDRRAMLGWDLWNEPNNGGRGNYKPTPDKKAARRQADPAGVRLGALGQPELSRSPRACGSAIIGTIRASSTPTEKTQLTQSDVLTFHDYSWPEPSRSADRQIAQLWPPGDLHRIYGARQRLDLRRLAADRQAPEHVGMMNWGFVDGKTQTRLPWDSWKKPYVFDEPTIWFHEVFRGDGTPYRQAETDLIKRLATSPKGVVPAAPAIK